MRDYIQSIVQKFELVRLYNAFERSLFCSPICNIVTKSFVFAD